MVKLLAHTTKIQLPPCASNFPQSRNPRALSRSIPTRLPIGLKTCLRHSDSEATVNMSRVRRAFRFVWREVQNSTLAINGLEDMQRKEDPCTKEWTDVATDPSPYPETRPGY